MDLQQRDVRKLLVREGGRLPGAGQDGGVVLDKPLDDDVEELWLQHGPGDLVPVVLDVVEDPVRLRDLRGHLEVLLAGVCVEAHAALPPHHVLALLVVVGVVREVEAQEGHDVRTARTNLQSAYSTTIQGQKLLTWPPLGSRLRTAIAIKSCPDMGGLR